MEYIDSILVSLKLASLQQIPFTQIAILILAGSTVSLAYNMTKNMNYLAERLNTLDIDVKCAHTIARMCDEDISNSNISDIPEIKKGMDILHSNITKAVDLLEFMKNEVQQLITAHTHDTTVYQQWHGIMKGETDYGKLELTVTVTNMEVNTRSKNEFWLNQNTIPDSYIDEIVQDSIVTMSTVPFTHKERSVVKDSLGFSGLIRTRVEWNAIGRYYEVPSYFKKYKIQWEKRLVPSETNL